LGKSFARPLAAHQHQGTTAVSHQAAIEHRQWITDKTRSQHLLDAERLPRIGQRIELRPLARRHRDVRQVFARAAVLVHVARGGQGVAGNREARLVGRFVQRGLGHRLELAEARTLVAAVANERHFALAGVQRHGSGEQVAHIRRAADHRGFAELGMDAQIFGHR
jgi:hypothetical protein